MTKTNYHRNDLIDLIREQYKDAYPSMSGSLIGALTSVLIRLEVEDPELFQEIMAFEMATQELMKSVHHQKRGNVTYTYKENNND
jgi:hypothetical protein